MIVLDSNILVYAVDSEDPQHGTCREVMVRAMRGSLRASVFPQNLLEFYSTVTSLRRTPRPVTTAQAMQRVVDWRRRLTVLLPNVRCLDEFEALVERTPRGRQHVYDLFLAAQMRAHGIAEICTANARDFDGIPGITVRSPESV